MLIYRYLSFLHLHLILLVHVRGQISLNRLQNGEVLVYRHPEDPQPLYRLPTLIVPGSIEYETTVDGVVIKFSTSMELTRTSAKSPASSNRQRGTTTSHDHQIRATKVHEGVIRVFSDSNIIVPFDDAASPIPLSSLPVIPSSISLPESSSSSPSSISPSASSVSESATVSPFELLNFPHAPTPVLPVFPSPSSPSPDHHLYASFFPLPFEESPFEALRSKVKSSSRPSIFPSSSGSDARAGKTLTSPSNPWQRLFGQQIHASASSSSSISRSGHEASSSIPSSRDAQRVRMNRLKLKVKNTDKLYDICLKDVCLRGELPQAVLLIGSQMPSPMPTASVIPLTPSARSHPEDSLDAKSLPSDDPERSKDLLLGVKGSKDETYEDERSGTKSVTNYDFPLPNDWREIQDLQTVENQRIRNQIKLNIEVPSFHSRNITSSEASLSSSSLSTSLSSSSGSGVREARMKSGSHALPALAFLSLPAPAAAAGDDPGARTSHVSMKVAGSWAGSESGRASAEALILAPSMTPVAMDTQTVTGDAMAAAGGNQELHWRYTSQQTRDPLLPIMSSSASISNPNLMDAFIPLAATPVLPHEAASLFQLYPSDGFGVGSLMTLSQTYSRPMGSTSRITVWKHRNMHDHHPTNFTITESFFINQVITAFRTMPSAIMTHAVLNPDWDPKKMIKSSSTTTPAPIASTKIFPNDLPILSLPPYVPMIEPSAFAFAISEDMSDHSHRDHHIHEHSHAQAESRQINVNLRRNVLSRLQSRNSRGPSPPVLAVASVTVKTQLRSQLQTKILAIIYNADSTKFKTITHTKYFSTRITMTRTSDPGSDVPITRDSGSG